MCGISLIINPVSEGDIHRMSDAISHRGTTTHIERFDRFEVGYNWLRITDQTLDDPIFKVGLHRVWLNGYISNWEELARKYQIRVVSSCDSELLVKLLALKGMDCLMELNGFFAFIWYDGRDIRAITDRYGIKQLYRYKQGQTTYICSEIKGIKALGHELTLDDNAIQDWKYSLGVMTDHTIYKDVERVSTLPFQIKRDEIKIDYEDAAERLKTLLSQSADRNQYDGAGCFLSGGVDSGVVSKLLLPFYNFSMGYVDPLLSEHEGFMAMSDGRHYSAICNKHLVAIYKDISARIIDDPKVGSCYTNYALTELASKFCTVLYSGAGGDELFGGYPHRNDRPIEEVIPRTDAKSSIFVTPTHDEYNFRYLKGVLVVEDRMSGYFTMETRYPLLDNDLVDFVLSLPMSYRRNKRILKDAVPLPDVVSKGKKRGWTNPYLTNKQWTDLVLQTHGIYTMETGSTSI